MQRCKVICLQATLVSRMSSCLEAVQTNSCAGKAAALQQNDVIEYVNNKQGYRIERPSSWEQTSKAGADVLFTDPLKKSTTIGVTVNPIKIAGLEQFGDVKTVREKLVNTEKQKVCSLHASEHFCSAFCCCILAGISEAHCRKAPKKSP